MRKHLLALGSCILMWAGAAVSVPAEPTEGALKKVSLLLDWYPQAEQGGFFYALINGLYKKAGLDVDLVPVDPNVAGEGQVALGRVQFMWNTSNQLMSARARGLPIVAVMAAMQHDPKGLMVHADSPVHSFSDLSGHAITVAPGSAWFRYVVRKYDLKNIEEHRLLMSSALFLHDPGAIQECFVTSEPYFVEKSGVKVRALLVADTGFDPYRAVATSDSFLSHNKDVVQAFVTASIEGWKGYMSDPAATEIEIKRRNPEMTQGQMDYSWKKMREEHFIEGDASKGEAIGQINAKRIAQQCKILQDLGLLPADFDDTKAFDNTFCSPLAQASRSTFILHERFRIHE